MATFVIQREDGTFRGHDGQPCRTLREAAHYDTIGEATRRQREYHPDEGFVVKEVTLTEVKR